MQIILASGSYKRREILEKAKIPFEAVTADVDEHAFDDLPAKERVIKIAQAKAEKVAQEYPMAIIIAADCMSVGAGEEIQGKPKDLAEGIKLAMSYSGQETTCYTGVCLIHPKFGKVSEVAETTMRFVQFNEEELKRLVDEKFLLRAGALGISEETAGFTLVENFSGSYTGAYGLPMEIVRKYLRIWDVI